MNARAAFTAFVFGLGCRSASPKYNSMMPARCDVVAMPRDSLSISPEEVLVAITPRRVSGFAVWTPDTSVRLPFDLNWTSRLRGETGVERFANCRLSGAPALVLQADFVMHGTIGDWPIMGVFEQVEIRAYEPTWEGVPFGSYLQGVISVDPELAEFAERHSTSKVPWESPMWQITAPWRTNQSLGVVAGQTYPASKGKDLFIKKYMKGFMFEDTVVDRQDGGE